MSTPTQSNIDTLYGALVEAAVDGIITIDERGIIHSFNQAAEKLFGYTRQEVIGQSVNVLMPRHYAEQHDEYIENYLKGYKAKIIGIGRDVPGQRKDGNVFPMHLSVGEAQEAAMERAKYLMSHDQLTGLLNRQALLHRFNKQAKRYATYAVLYFDCNHFGLINQKFGHELGDQLLLIAAQRLSKTLPDTALIARPGGDDFIVVCPVEHSSDTPAMAALVIKELQEPYELGEHLLKVRGRVGIAHYPHDGTDLDDVIRMAESAIFYKDRLADGLGFYSPEQQQTMMRTLDIEQRLRVALDLAHLDVYLQPKFTLADNQLVGYEALLRWQDGDIFISPGEFIPIAESMGLGIELDRYVIQQVCHALATAQQSGLRVSLIAINITMRHFGHADFCDFLSSCLQQSGLAPTLIELEITEGVLMDRQDKTQTNLSRLREQGIRINIDDFGTGYSSLSYLADLPVDVIKIDRAFVESLNTTKGLRLVEGIIAMADAMHLDVVAEGIETQEQVNVLKSLGCRVGQGFLLGKPQPINTALDIPSA